MQYSLILFSKLTSMMLMAGIGYLLVKLRLIQEKDSKVLTVLLVYALQPFQIFRVLQIDLTPERATGFIAAIVFATCCMLIAAIVANVFRRPLRLDSVDMATLMYSNIGNLILPVIAMTLGDEMTFYCSGFQIPFNLLFWTYGYVLMSGRRDIPVRKILLNPNLIAIFAGLIVLISGLKVPAVIDAAMEGMHNMVAGTSMLLVGVVVAESKLAEIFTSPRVYLISFGRLIAIPMITILALYASGFLARYPQYTTVLMTIMISAAAPAASSVIQLSVLFGKDAGKAGAYNVMSTLLCVFTSPFVIFVYQMVFPG